MGSEYDGTFGLGGDGTRDGGYAGDQSSRWSLFLSQSWTTRLVSSSTARTK